MLQEKYELCQKCSDKYAVFAIEYYEGEGDEVITKSVMLCRVCATGRE